MFATMLVNAQDRKHDLYWQRDLQLADDYFHLNKFAKALEIYEKLYSVDSSNDELNYDIAICHFTMSKQHNNALRFFHNTVDNKVDPEKNFYLCVLYLERNQLDSAEWYLVKYLNDGRTKNVNHQEIDRIESNIENARRAFAVPPLTHVNNLGEPINSKYSDYVPLVSANENKIIFTSRRFESSGDKDENGLMYEHILSSVRENGKFIPPVMMKTMNKEHYQNACVGLTADGQNLIIYASKKGHASKGDLYLSTLTDSGWSNTQKFPSQINSESSNEFSATLSADGQILYFSSDRPGGFGGLDLYRSVKLPDGTWSKAVNLGSRINTKYNEDAPFVHPSGSVLYFSSQGHSSIGGYDLFYTEADSMGYWGNPQNMDIPINSTSDDIFLSITPNGQHGYFASTRHEGYGESDIYYFNSDVSYQKQYHVIKGKIIDDAGTPVIVTHMTLINNDTKKVEGIYCNNKNGNFIVVVDDISKYTLFIEAGGHQAIHVPLDNSVESMGQLILNRLK